VYFRFVKKNLLHQIDNPDDLKKIPQEELPILAKELRDFIIDIVATKEGHLGASLGVVELSIALHYVFSTPKDLLVWDVGHQAYGHKILTGRKEIFNTNRQLNGISGFPKITESVYDAFGTGHSSTSISAVLGMAIASKLKGEINKQHIAVIGDASIASGMAFEALNQAGTLEVNMLIILNDNSMGIDPNVGALNEHFKDLKSNKTTAIFELLEIDYYGVVDGHNIKELINKLTQLKKIKGVKVLHIKTVKGKGLAKAEENQITYHAPGKFDKISGELIKSDANLPLKCQDVFGYTLLELAKHNDKIVAITPAMPTGSSLNYMMEKFPERTFNVGIAEQHAVTLAAGMATQGLIPFCTIYSTFLQRAYDQIIHDVALQKLPVIFCIDRAGIVGEDGATHHGVFDIASLRIIPNLIIAAPLNAKEFQDLLYTAQKNLDFPIAIRYPRGRMMAAQKVDFNINQFNKLKIGQAKQVSFGKEIAILTIGTIGNTIIELCKDAFYSEKITHINMIFVKPLDEVLLHKICQNYKKIITIEDGVLAGGFGSAILEFIQEHNYKNTQIKRLGVPDNFIEHGKVSELHAQVGIDFKTIKKEIDFFNLL